MTISNITPKEVQELLNKDQAIVIDVREPEEYNTIHIKEAINIPLGSISKADIDKYTNKNIVIHCKSGMRSMQACQKLDFLDDSVEKFNLEGGIQAWEKAGLEVVKS